MGDTKFDEALAAFKKGRPVIIMDDDKRENEGDLCLPAQFVEDSHVLFFLHHSTGILCVSISPLRTDELELPLMVAQNTDSLKTPFTVSVDLDRKHGTSTGVSAKDKAKTIRALADPKMRATDFSRPGHIFPLRASPKGLHGRQGHTEASVELCKLAGVYPACMIAELMNSDGTMSRLEECREFGLAYTIPVITVKDIQSRLSIPPVTLPVSIMGRTTEFNISTFPAPNGEKYTVLSKGDLHGKTNVPLRIHSECLTGDVFRSVRCDCGSQLEVALEALDQSEMGILVYVQGQEGRGIGLENKLKAYALQDKHGYDTYTANEALHLPSDCRDYSGVTKLLEQLEVKSVILYTQNPIKLKALDPYISKVVPLPGIVTPQNKKYLQSKAEMVESKKKKLKIGIAYTTAWHKKQVQHLLVQCRQHLTAGNVEIIEKGVSGSFELVMGARFLFEQGCQSVIVLGILLKGQTYHFEAITDSVSQGVMSLQLLEKKSIIYGVLSCYTQEQIDERVFGDKNATVEWCQAAIDMI